MNTLPAPGNTDTMGHHFHTVKGKFCNGSFKHSLGGTYGDNSNDDIFAWMDVGNHGCGSLEWCRGVFTQQDEGTRLEVRGCLHPAWTLFQALEVVG